LIERFPQNGEGVAVVIRQANKAGIKEETTARILSTALERGIKIDEVGRILRPMIKAGENGLPVEPFSDKVLEGFAKSVDSDLIVRVLEGKLSTYQKAKQLLSGAMSQNGDDSEALKSVALAMERGVSPRGIKQLYADKSHDSKIMGYATQTTADLVSMGFKEAEGVAISKSGLEAGYLRKGGATLTRIAAQAQKSGLSTSTITKNITSALQRGMTLSEISIELKSHGKQRGSGKGMQRRRGTAGAGYTDGMGKRQHGK
jgi:hypothetical protein